MESIETNYSGRRACVLNTVDISKTIAPPSGNKPSGDCYLSGPSVMFSRLTTFFKSNNKPGEKRTGCLSKDECAGRKNGKKSVPATIEKRKIQCRVLLLDDSYLTVVIDKDALGEELMDQVVRALDLVERDYFSLRYEFGDSLFWLDPSKPVRIQIKKNFDFHFSVKFFSMDPDELQEELTRYHFYLQARRDIRQRKLAPSPNVNVELAALTLQSEIGDHSDAPLTGNYASNYKFIPKQTEEFELQAIKRHQELTGMTPGECEQNYLRIVKTTKNYGLHKFSVSNTLGLQHELGVGPQGLVICRNNVNLETYYWGQVTLVAFKRRVLKLKLKHKTTRKKLKCYMVVESTCIAKDIWKLCIDYHTFFSPPKKKGGFSSGFGNVQTHQYRGRTLYESIRAVRNSVRKKSFRRKTPLTHPGDKATAGQLRVGSRVLSRGYNGEYFHGQIATLSDKIYVRNDNGNTAAFERDDAEAVVFDAQPDHDELDVGSRVLARWPGIDSFLPGFVKSIEGSANFTRYWICFDDEDHHWNNVDQIRLLKPPKYFGPGSKVVSQKGSSALSASRIVEILSSTPIAEHPSVAKDPSTQPNELENGHESQRNIDETVSSDKYCDTDEQQQQPKQIPETAL